MRNKITTFEELQYKVEQWCNKNFPNNKPYHPLLGVNEEVGELNHHHLKQNQKIRGDSDKHQLGKADAVGDIVIYLTNYCQLNNLNLADCINLAWKEIEQRDWNKNPEKGKE